MVLHQSGFLAVVRSDGAKAGQSSPMAEAGERAQTAVSGWGAQGDLAGQRAQTGERAQTVTTDQEMYGLGHDLHHFVDLREFPEDKHAQYMSLHKTQSFFSFETGNTIYIYLYMLI